MPEIPKSVVDEKIMRFVNLYGPEQLIEWLDEFDYMGGPDKYRQFKKVEKITCQEFDITIADMHKVTKNPDAIDARRIIAFIAANKINMSQVIIAKHLGVSIRSSGYYIADAEKWILDPRTNRRFFEHYNKIMDKFKVEVE